MTRTSSPRKVSTLIGVAAPGYPDQLVEVEAVAALPVTSAAR